MLTTNRSLGIGLFLALAVAVILLGFNNPTPGVASRTDATGSSAGPNAYKAPGRAAPYSVIGGPCVTPPADMVGWWPGDGNADDIQDGNDGMLQNTATFDTGEVGQAFSFDGGGFVTVPDSASLQLPDAPFTIDLWFKTNTTATSQMILSKGVSDANEEYSINLFEGGGIYWDYGGTQAFVASDTAGVVAGQWYHLAVVYDPAVNPRGKIYLNGVSQTISGSAAGAHIASSGGDFYLGTQNAGSPYYGGRVSFNGLIDEVEIFSRALTLAEIQSIFNAGSSGKCKTCVTPPANMVGWYPGDNNANDITASPDNGTLNGSATFAAGKVAQAFSLNGTTAYVSAPDVAKLDFGTGDFSIDAWINSSGAGTIQPIVDKRDGDNSSVFTGYSFFTFNGNLGVQLADGTASNFVSTTDVVDGTFHHVAVTVVRNSTTGGNLYVDGVSVLTFNPTARSGSLDNGAELRIGRNSPNTILDPFFQGLIDEVELFNRALSASEVQSIFTAAGTAGKCKCTITCPANVTTSNDTDQCGAVVNYTAPTVTGPCTAICSPASGSFFPKGTTTVTCSTTDPSGNIFSCSFTVTVNDTQPPAITCPANVTAAAPVTCPPATSLVVTYPAPMVSDNCPGVTSMCVPASGSTFPLGTTTVTCTATDTSGNTASCSFTVTVFSICVQDDSNPNKVVFVNLVTGDYLFCCDGTIYSGKGTVSRQGCIYTLVHNSPTRRVLIKVNLATKTGTASLQQPPGQTKCSITDRDLMNNSCVCGNQQALRRR